MNIPDLRAKADSGNCAAQAILGICYLEGIDAETDFKKHSVCCQPLLHRALRAQWSASRACTPKVWEYRKTYRRRFVSTRRPLRRGNSSRKFSLAECIPAGWVSRLTLLRRGGGMQPQLLRRIRSLTEKNSEKRRLTSRNTPDSNTRTAVET
jgi:hypothetical protein